MVRRKVICGLILATLVLLVTGCEDDNEKNKISGPLLINEGNAGGFASTHLIAGNSVIIGEVNVSVSGDNIIVVFRVTSDGWFLSETNLAVEKDPADIPQTETGNPRPKDFEYSTKHNPSVKEYTYNIPKGAFTTVYIAAHAYVLNPISENCTSYTQRESVIPDKVVNVVNTLTPGGSGLYKVKFSDAGDLNGEYTGWCADNNQKKADFRKAHLISSYSKTADLGQIVPLPSNLPRLNYMLNKNYLKYESPVIQAAVWRLMNGKFDNPGGGIELTADQMKQLNTIISDALEKGNNFIPGPSDYLVVLVDSGDRIKYQNVLFLFKQCLPVYQIEISWGDGYKFPGNSWAKYFGYSVQ